MHCKESPFSFAESLDMASVPLPAPAFLTASDGMRLAYYYMKVRKPVAVLIFIHGGGAFSGAGYQYLATALNKNFNINVLLFDLRGHGNSEGPRGDSPFVDQIFYDIKYVIEFVKINNPNLPIYLGGHSSGAGLTLNYHSWNNAPDIKGYFFISPEFGYKANTWRRKIKCPFARVNFFALFLHSVTKGRLFGTRYAVFFNYPDEVLKKQPLIVTSITCNMAAALTPKNPQRQFSSINKPFGLFIGENDELFDPHKVIYYVNLPDNNIMTHSSSQIIPAENHLSIIRSAAGLIGVAIMKFLSYQSASEPPVLSG